MYDVIILGAGPAGMSAAIYLGRKKIKTLLLTTDFGGQMSKAAEIENYPGILKTSGEELTSKMQEQVESLEIEVKNMAADLVVKKDNFFEVASGSETFQAKSVLITSGKTHRCLDVPGEKEFTGKGVSYCVTCDGPLFQGKSVAVVGGGNSALDAALELKKYVRKVYILNLNETFQGDEVRVDQVKEAAEIEIIAPAQVVALLGSQNLEKLKYKDLKGNEEKEIEINGCFIEVGWQPSAGPVKDLVELNNLGEIKVDKSGKTNCEGIFAAGDVTDTLEKQIVIAAGDGARTALTLWKWLIMKK